MSKRKKRKSSDRKPAEPPEVQPAPRSTSITHAALFALTGLALVLRLLWLGRAHLWQDEMIFVSILATPEAGPGETFVRYWDYLISMGQMPLAGVLQNIYIALLEQMGVSDAVQRPGLMRFPMAVLGALAVPGVYLAARRLMDETPAWIAACFMAAFFFPVYYSREAYCYAHVLFFSAWGWYAWLRLLEGGGWRIFALTVVCFAGLALSHLGAVVAVAAWAGVAGAFWMAGWMGKQEPERIRRLFVGTLAPGFAFLIALPYFVHFMFNNVAHIGAGTQENLFIILNDGLNKMFLGEFYPLAALSWLLLAVGVYAAVSFRSRPGGGNGPWLAGAAMTPFLLLAIATMNTQYISARYFSPLTVPFYFLFALGIWRLAGVVSRFPGRHAPSMQSKLAGGLALLCILPHLFVYLPLYWRLEQKHENFGSVADWLNEHVAPGTPYLVESAYQYRFIGGFHPVPNLIPIVPYVHGTGPEELRRLQERQKDFIRRFPETVLITLGHPDGNQPERIWAWPPTHFRNHVEIRNDGLHRLIRLGIYPGMPYEELTDTSYRMDIYYDTPSDIRERALASGNDLLFSFDGWQIQGQPVSPREHVYFRLARGTRGAFRVINPHAHPVSGRLDLQTGWIGPPDVTAGIQVEFEDDVVYRGAHRSGDLIPVRLEWEEIPPGESRIHVRAVEGAGRVQGLIIMDARWHPEARRNTR